MRCFRGLGIFFLSALLIGIAAHASGGITTATIEYTIGNQKFIGYLAYDDAIPDARPGIVVIHEWWGLNEYAKMRARHLAELGYVAFAADMYGDGKVATTREEAGRMAGAVRSDAKLFRERAQKAVEIVRRQKQTDASRIGAIGYCFGGMGVLELARSGADLRGVVSFHGTLRTSMPAEPGVLRAQVLVLNGAADPSISREDILGFWDEMDSAGATWQFVNYSSAVHTFTNPAAGDDPSRGSAYNEIAARRSWEAMKAFFADIFGDPKPHSEKSAL